MHPSLANLASPCPTEAEGSSRRDLERHMDASTSSEMLQVNSLLDHSATERKRLQEVSPSPPITPATTQASSTTSTPMSTKAQKQVKDSALFIRGTPKEPVNYRPHECSQDSGCLSPSEQTELARQHGLFNVFPSGRGEDGLIVNYQRHIPYSSEKKTFSGKTNRDAFEVFQYTFRMPGDPNNREYVVMWDYQVGLVRITPFFKALKYTKTTPARALTVNEGLKELSHSITGGALAAQGYWMPYSCARAICLTFCYPIRWVLTPVFGPSFIKECYHPEHGSYRRFKIPAAVVRSAALETERMRLGNSSGSSSPTSEQSWPATGAGQEMPRSAPPPTSGLLMPLRRRKQSLMFKLGSPFESDSESSEVSHGKTVAAIESPGMSPGIGQGMHRNPGLVDVNHHVTSTPPSRLSVMEVPSTPRRVLEPSESTPGWAQQPTNPADKLGNSKRRRTTTSSTDTSGGSRTKDSVGATVWPPPAKRLCRGREDIPVPDSSSPSPTQDIRDGRGIKYNASEYAAAQSLLSLSANDARLGAATGA